MDKLIVCLCRAIGVLGAVLVVEGIVTIDVASVLFGSLIACGFACLSVRFEDDKDFE